MLAIKATYWPHVRLYPKQKEILRSVAENVETYAPAGNMLGKDYVAALTILCYFLSRLPCRIVTTSATERHLKVLWGEIGNFIATAAHPLSADRGGPLIINHQHLRLMLPGGKECPKSYAIAMVASQDSMAAMQGHHVPNVGDGIARTLFVADECSSVPDGYHKMADSWANRRLMIGNTWDCANFFRRGIDAGDKYLTDGTCYRRVIRITAEDHPNVARGLAQKAAGQEPDDAILLPGKSYAEYAQNLETWDEAEKTVKLWAQFYEGKELRLFPADWLARAADPELVRLCQRHPAEAIGCDPAEGGDKTSMAAVNRYGVKELVSRKTPNTDDIPRELIAFGRRHGVSPESWLIDRGGGGKQHADRLREQGYAVRTVGFGEPPSLEIRRGLHQVSDRKGVQEERYAYVNLRAEMYGELSQALDPAAPHGFAVPGELTELRHQLSKIPKKYDEEGRLKLPPKNKVRQDSKEPTLIELIGHSPDEADSVVLGNYGIKHKRVRPFAGAV